MSANKKLVKVSNKDPSTMGVSEKSGTPDVSPEQRFQMIAEAAYYVAETQGFQGHDPQADWLIAEIEISKT